MSYMNIGDATPGSPERASSLATGAHVQPFDWWNPAPWLNLLETFLQLLCCWSHVTAQKDEEGCKHECLIQLVHRLQVDVMFVVFNGKTGGQAVDWDHEDDADISAIGYDELS